MCPVVNVAVVNKRCPANILTIVRRPSPVVKTIVLIHILWFHKYPPAFRAVECNAYANSRTQWRPSAVAAAITPAHPCRGPLITWNPNPAIVWIVGPPAIVVAGPSPWIVRYPCVTIFSHCPMPACAIWPEITFFIRHPYVTVLRVIHPLPVWR